MLFIYFSLFTGRENYRNTVEEAIYIGQDTVHTSSPVKEQIFVFIFDSIELLKENFEVLRKRSVD